MADPKVREELPKAAEKQLADAICAATSVQDNIDATRFTKPVLCDHFQSKAGIDKAPADYAYNVCLRLMRQAAARGASIIEQLVEILAELSEALQKRLNLSRIACAPAFAGRGESPEDLKHQAQGKRNFEWVYSIIQKEGKEAAPDRCFNTRELAYGIYGALTFHLMANVLEEGAGASRRTAKGPVRPLLGGAGTK